LHTITCNKASREDCRENELHYNLLKKQKFET